MDMATWVQILDKAVYISHSTNTLGKGTSPTIVGQTGLFNLDMATAIGEEKLWIQTCCTPLKNWPCSGSCLREGVGKYIYYFLNVSYSRPQIFKQCGVK